MASYEEQLATEAALWGSVDEAAAVEVPPDWQFHRGLRHNVVLHTPQIDALLAHIQPGMRVLELGCASGWLTIAAARQGAHAEGLDISTRSLAVAQAYYQQMQAEIPGTATYRVADLNRLSLPAQHYDVIFTKGTLHHLPDTPSLIETVQHALKPGGLFWISDQDGDEAPRTALVAAALMFLLPTTVTYRQKITGLLKFRQNAVQRIQMSMEAQGLSPFEGAGREHDWVRLVAQQFEVQRQVRLPAVTGYITHQLRLPDALALPLIRALSVMDGALVRWGLLKTTGVIVWARKR